MIYAIYIILGKLFLWCEVLLTWQDVELLQGKLSYHTTEMHYAGFLHPQVLHLPTEFLVAKGDSIILFFCHHHHDYLLKPF